MITFVVQRKWLLYNHRRAKRTQWHSGFRKWLAGPNGPTHAKHHWSSEESLWRNGATVVVWCFMAVSTHVWSMTFLLQAATTPIYFLVLVAFCVACVNKKSHQVQTCVLFCVRGTRRAGGKADSCKLQLSTALLGFHPWKDGKSFI